MARFIFRGSKVRNIIGSFFWNRRSLLFWKICFVAAAALVFALAQSPVLAQRVGGHVGVGRPATGAGARVGSPAGAPISRPGIVGVRRGVGSRGVGPNGVGFAGVRGLRFGAGPIRIFHPHIFVGVPFFRFGVGLGFNSLWWPSCGLTLGWGYDCNPMPMYGYGFENYVAPQIYENTIYGYGGGERDLVWLYMKDGRALGVTDYWFVNGQVHFSTVEDGMKADEHLVPYEQMDVQKTIFVNTRRGFRIVFRDEPWQQYLKDHPDAIPSDVPPPQG
jgi:hypothetical protein